MNKVIPLFGRDEPSRAYREALSDAVERLDEAAESLWDAATAVAFTGPWAAWADAQPEGAVVNVTPDALRQTNDPALQTLLALSDALLAARAAMHPPSG